jgi:4'-phosphopantetheinyl transferase
MGLWQIDEEPDFFLSQLTLCHEEKEFFVAFKHDLRRKHWLSYRLLIQKMLGEEKPHHVVYDMAGKPVLADNSYKISVSHSGNFSVVIISKGGQVGIDIEQIHPRIKKVASKFLSKKELSDIPEDNQEHKLTIYWSAKEALYKACEIRQLDFAEGIFIQPFSSLKSGDLESIVIINKNPFRFQLHYEIIDNYILVYVY